MEELTRLPYHLWAKKSKPGAMTWLPLPWHMADAAAIARLLWKEWLSPGTAHAIETALDNPGQAEALFIFLAAVHDLGKATPVFQAKQRHTPADDLDAQLLEGLIGAGLPCEQQSAFLDAKHTPHALASEVILRQFGCPAEIAGILGAHHGKPASVGMIIDEPYHKYAKHYYLEMRGRDAWRRAQEELLAFALRLAGVKSLQDLPKPEFAAQVLLSALVVMTDWIASNEWYFPYWAWGQPTQPPYGVNRARKAWERLALTGPWVRDVLAQPQYYLDRFGIQCPYAAQQAALDAASRTAQPGILILEAPMGSGKTEAALVAAEVFADKANRSGVFFALPTQATSNAIFARISAWTKALDLAGPASIRLAHGKAQFNDEYQALAQAGYAAPANVEDISVHPWFEGNKKSLLANFVVGTIDQFLLGALKQKHVMLRHMGLAGKVVILDECHAYDAYMNQYLDRALCFMGMYRVPVIILSATLPARRREGLVQAYLGRQPAPLTKREKRAGRGAGAPEAAPGWATSRAYPLITWTDGGHVNQMQVPVSAQSKRVALQRMQEKEWIPALQTLLQHGGYAGVVVNTVRRAQQFAMQLKAVFGDEQVTLTHARFVAPDRAAKEKQLLHMLGKLPPGQQRRGLHIVVGTQVIEQSLDIDFDVMVTDLCPMDLLLQRLGRLHRHERARPDGLQTARCLILGAQGEALDTGSKAVYHAYPLLRTLCLLPEEALTLPDDIPTLVQDTYDPQVALAAPPAGYAAAQQEWEKLTHGQQQRANAYRLRAPHPDDILLDWLANSQGQAGPDAGYNRHEAAGDAAVRDGAESVEVLVICRAGEGQYAPLPWVGGWEGERLAAGSRVPPDAQALMLARQSIRLPAELCHEGIIDQTIRALEKSNDEVSCWQQSPWLKGMLFLILDGQFSARLCGYYLTYDRALGLLCTKEGGDDGTKAL